jgi:Holliday junction resolvase RusA-like endonuclease
MKLEATLPLPPSTNNLFFTLKNGARAKTSIYKDWSKEADQILQIAFNRAGRPDWPDKTPMALEIRLGLTSRRRDQSNCLKAIEDAVCRLPVPDDRYFDRHLIERDPALDGTAVVRLYALEVGHG